MSSFGSKSTDGALAPLLVEPKISARKLFDSFNQRKLAEEIARLKQLPEYLQLESKFGKDATSESQNLLSLEQARFVLRNLSQEGLSRAKLFNPDDWDKRLTQQIEQQTEQKNLKLLQSKLTTFSSKLNQDLTSKSAQQSLNEIVEILGRNKFSKKSEITQSVFSEIIQQSVKAKLSLDTQISLFERLADLTKSLPSNTNSAVQRLLTQFSLSLSFTQKYGEQTVNNADRQLAEKALEHIALTKKEMLFLSRQGQEQTKAFADKVEVDLTRLELFVAVKNHNPASINELSRRYLLRTFDNQPGLGLKFLELVQTEAKSKFEVDTETLGAERSGRHSVKIAKFSDTRISNLTRILNTFSNEKKAEVLQNTIMLAESTPEQSVDLRFRLYQLASAFRSNFKGTAEQEKTLDHQILLLKSSLHGVLGRPEVGIQEIGKYERENSIRESDPATYQKLSERRAKLLRLQATVDTVNREELIRSLYQLRETFERDPKIYSKSTSAKIVLEEALTYLSTNKTEDGVNSLNYLKGKYGEVPGVVVLADTILGKIKNNKGVALAKEMLSAFVNPDGTDLLYGAAIGGISACVLGGSASATVGLLGGPQGAGALFLKGCAASVPTGISAGMLAASVTSILKKSNQIGYSAFTGYSTISLLDTSFLTLSLGLNLLGARQLTKAAPQIRGVLSGLLPKTTSQLDDIAKLALPNLELPLAESKIVYKFLHDASLSKLAYPSESNSFLTKSMLAFGAGSLVASGAKAYLSDLPPIEAESAKHDFRKQAFSIGVMMGGTLGAGMISSAAARGAGLNPVPKEKLDLGQVLKSISDANLLSAEPELIMGMGFLPLPPINMITNIFAGSGAAYDELQLAFRSIFGAIGRVMPGLRPTDIPKAFGWQPYEGDNDVYLTALQNLCDLVAQGQADTQAIERDVLLSEANQIYRLVLKNVAAGINFNLLQSETIPEPLYQEIKKAIQVASNQVPEPFSKKGIIGRANLDSDNSSFLVDLINLMSLLAYSEVDPSIQPTLVERLSKAVSLVKEFPDEGLKQLRVAGAQPILYITVPQPRNPDSDLLSVPIKYVRRILPDHVLGILEDDHGRSIAVTNSSLYLDRHEIAIAERSRIAGVTSGTLLLVDAEPSVHVRRNFPTYEGYSFSVPPNSSYRNIHTEVAVPLTLPSEKTIYLPVNYHPDGAISSKIWGRTPLAPGDRELIDQLFNISLASNSRELFSAPISHVAVSQKASTLPRIALSSSIEADLSDLSSGLNFAPRRMITVYDPITSVNQLTTTAPGEPNYSVFDTVRVAAFDRYAELYKRFRLIFKDDYEAEDKHNRVIDLHNKLVDQLNDYKTALFEGLSPKLPSSFQADMNDFSKLAIQLESDARKLITKFVATGNLARSTQQPGSVATIDSPIPEVGLRRFATDVGAELSTIARVASVSEKTKVIATGQFDIDTIPKQQLEELMRDALRTMVAQSGLPTVAAIEELSSAALVVTVNQLGQVKIKAIKPSPNPAAINDSLHELAKNDEFSHVGILRLTQKDVDGLTFPDYAKWSEWYTKKGRSGRLRNDSPWEIGSYVVLSGDLPASQIVDELLPAVASQLKATVPKLEPKRNFNFNTDSTHVSRISVPDLNVRNIRSIGAKTEAEGTSASSPAPTKPPPASETEVVAAKGLTTEPEAVGLDAHTVSDAPVVEVAPREPLPSPTDVSKPPRDYNLNPNRHVRNRIYRQLLQEQDARRAEQENPPGNESKPTPPRVRKMTFGPLEFDDLKKVIESRGYVLRRITGSHHRFENSSGQVVGLPHSNKRTVSDGQANDILKELGLTRREAQKIIDGK